MVMWSKQGEKKRKTISNYTYSYTHKFVSELDQIIDNKDS